jgi:hypothetical protein
MKIRALEVHAECEGEEGVELEIVRLLDTYFVTVLLRDGTTFKVSSKNVRLRTARGDQIFRA